MATVKFIASKRMQSRQGLASILAYCKKTLYNGRKLISGVNCVPQSAFNEMMNTKIQYRKTDGRMYYHLFQSFHPYEPITPETAHEVVLKFAQEQFKGYEVLVATHVDREHIHSHFIVNSVNAETGLKYHPNKNEIQRLRDYSDKICREYGLSVVIPKPQKVKQMSAREYRSADKGQSWKLQLALDEISELTTKEEIRIYLNRQMNSLQKSIDNSNAMARTFKMELQNMTNNYVNQINDAAKNASQQVGSTSEKYSYSISQAEEKLNHHARILFFLALIPTAITATTEMILHIWSQISQIF